MGSEPKLITRGELREAILDALTEIELQISVSVDPVSGTGNPVQVVADPVADHITDRVWRDFFAIPGACDDPECPVLHADPERPIHPPLRGVPEEDDGA